VNDVIAIPRTALLAGATGLVGRALLSMLLGDRAAWGQPARSGEVWATRVVGPLGWIIPKAVRPIPARAVASALLAAILDAKPVLKSGAMQAHDQP